MGIKLYDDLILPHRSQYLQMEICTSGNVRLHFSSICMCCMLYGWSLVRYQPFLKFCTIAKGVNFFPLMNGFARVLFRY